MKIQHHTIAALLYLPPVIAVLSVWYVLLFIGNTTSMSPMSNLQYFLFVEPKRVWFWWLLALPVSFLGLAASYVSEVATTLRGSVSLLLIGTVLAIATWLTLTHSIALFASFPLLYSFLAAKQIFSSDQGKKALRL